ncbi:hypothetical protein F4679DRAFT_567229 [Xylaria curta]|nr:hypothetical protein F4679DRAFT_567229 [Xylaria curta]
MQSSYTYHLTMLSLLASKIFSALARNYVTCEPGDKLGLYTVRKALVEQFMGYSYCSAALCSLSRMDLKTAGKV